MTKKAAKDFASTSHKGLPEKVEETFEQRLHTAFSEQDPLVILQTLLDRSRQENFDEGWFDLNWGDTQDITHLLRAKLARVKTHPRNAHAHNMQLTHAGKIALAKRR